MKNYINVLEYLKQIQFLKFSKIQNKQLNYIVY